MDLSLLNNILSPKVGNEQASPWVHSEAGPRGSALDEVVQKERKAAQQAFNSFKLQYCGSSIKDLFSY